MTATTIEDTQAALESAEGDGITMTSGIASLMPFARRARGPFAISIAIACVSTLHGLAPYWVVDRAVDEVVRAGAGSEGLVRLAALALVTIVLRFLLLGVSITVAHVGAYRVLCEIRMALAEHLARVPLGYVTRMGADHGLLAEMNAAIVGLIRRMPVVKVFDRADDEVRGTEATVHRYVETVRAYSLDFLPFGTAFYVVFAANAAAIAPVGRWLSSRGEISTTDLLFFVVVGLGASTPLVSLLHLFANLSHLTKGGNLIRGIMDAAVLEEGAGAVEPAIASINVRGVSFGYDGHDVLHDVSLRADRGSSTALVGPSGSGKSTIASLVARFRDVREGQTLVRDVDPRDPSLDRLTRHVSVALQDTFLVDDTSATNLRVGWPVAMESVA